ncbi:MAG TPA: phosphatidylserine decarboxylase [Bryobacteraceae bacterium]|nr:phosphatidylserine decarboxylase [Bryobacteraceae bacterium]
MRQCKKVVVYGIYYAAPLLVAGLLLSWFLSPFYVLPFLIVALFCIYFFRDPDRDTPPGPVAVAPADGKVVAIVEDDAGANRISIFLNIFDVHVNRTPIAGKVTCVTYKKGKFLVASQEDASQANEQNVITVEAGDGVRVVFKQIAGLIARRIVCYKKAGDILDAGERIGLIKFGSRVDVFLGPEWEIAVQRGDRVAAGASVIARRREARIA